MMKFAVRESSLPLFAVLAGLAMLLPVPVMQYIGEESYYAVSAIEMHITGQYWHQWIYGAPWPKTPLYLWFAIGLADLLGWQHIDIALRLVSVVSSWISAGVAGLLAMHLFGGGRKTGWLTALIYLCMGEVSFWYGWLGYADANFGMFVFGSIAALWVAIERRHLGWFVLSLLLVSMAFMSKNISGYYFYGVAAAVLIHRHRSWRLLYHPGFLIAGLLALMVPWWYQSTFANSNSMVAIRDGLRNFHGYDLWQYVRHWFGYPFIFIFRALPLSLLFLWLALRKKAALLLDAEQRTLLLILLGCFLPFWISGGGSPRYLVPFYALLAVLFAGLLLQLSSEWKNQALRLMMLVLLVKVPYSLAVLPYIKDWMPERSLLAVVQDIEKIADGKTIRTVDDIASGLSIAAYLDVRRPPEEYIRWYRGERGVFVMSDLPNGKFGQLVKHYPIRGRHLYLYWKP